ncbi:Uncharacterised protein [uncultured archaeon]|nr:Uncharacterised protein [uncultured archaeon]
MPWQIFAYSRQELCDSSELDQRVIVSWNDQGCDLHPDAGVPHQLDVLLNRFYPGSADLFIEFVISFQVNVVGIENRHDLLGCLLAGVPVANEDVS